MGGPGGFGPGGRAGVRSGHWARVGAACSFVCVGGYATACCLAYDLLYEGDHDPGRHQHQDRLARIADDEFHGASLGQTLQRLIDEHEMQAAHAAYARLRSDPAAWDEYRNEIAGWDVV